MIELKNLYKTFFSELGTEKQVFKGLNFTINDGDFITIIGSNGAGKCIKRANYPRWRKRDFKWK